jgi:DNA-binding transcriptional regulator WhiA
MTNFQEQVLLLIEEGLAVSEISKKLNRPMSSVSSVLKRFNKIPKKNLNENSVNHQYFDKIDTENKAYFLGFIIADGSISDKPRSIGRFSIEITEADKYILETLKKELNIKTDIKVIHSKKGAANRKPEAVLRWTSRPMLETLKTYDILPNKTHNTSFKFNLDIIPKEFLGDFIRGFIDGDGSFESKNGIFTPSIIGTSLDWLIQIGDVIAENTGLNYKYRKITGKTVTYYVLRWSSNNKDKPKKIEKLYNFLYNRAVTFLQRKKDKIVSYLKYRANQIRVKGIWQCRA